MPRDGICSTSENPAAPEQQRGAARTRVGLNLNEPALRRATHHAAEIAADAGRTSSKRRGGRQPTPGAAAALRRASAASTGGGRYSKSRPGVDGISCWNRGSTNNYKNTKNTRIPGRRTVCILASLILLGSDSYTGITWPFKGLPATQRARNALRRTRRARTRSPWRPGLLHVLSNELPSVRIGLQRLDVLLPSYRQLTRLCPTRSAPARLELDARTHHTASPLDRPTR